MIHRLSLRSIFGGILIALIIVGGFFVLGPLRYRLALQPPQYSVHISQVAFYGNNSYATAEYYISISASYTGTGKWPLEPTSFRLVMASSAVYTDEWLGGYYKQHLKPTDLSDRQSVSGQIHFEVPAMETPAKLEYSDPSTTVGDIVVPPVSSWISDPFPGSDVTVNGFQSQGRVTAGYDEPQIAQTGAIFYSGETIPLEILIFFGQFPGDPASIMVTQVTLTDVGLSINTIQPNLPITVLPWPAHTGSISVTIIAPAFSFTGPLHFEITDVSQ